MTHFIQAPPPEYLVFSETLGALIESNIDTGPQDKGADRLAFNLKDTGTRHINLPMNYTC